jgi:phosphoribosylformimino-5-aminoimidazole carboxamide ribotide isomerase
MEVVKQIFDIGVARLVLGTAAVEDQGLVREACRQFGEALLVAIDVRQGRVAIKGWQENSQARDVELIRLLQSLGVSRFVYTDISRDGTLRGPNFKAIEAVVKETGARIIASGGVASLQHLRRLARLKVEGAIVGRALYNGSLDLREALKLLRGAR